MSSKLTNSALDVAYHTPTCICEGPSRVAAGVVAEDTQQQYLTGLK
jgi:hypothetical protein